jgi:hypothetical protein
MSKVPSKRLKSAVNSKLSKTLSAGAFKHSRFSRANLTIFTIIFAAIGCYFLFFSHAATLVGDINSDGTVDATDFSFLVSSFGQATTTCTTNTSDTCDLNADGKVDFLDVSVLVSHWGQGIPKNTALPQISGATNQGSVLTATNGTWSGTTPTYTYQWRDCDSSGNNCTSISGATNSSYTLTATDVSHTIRVVVTATNSFSAVSATSNPTAVILAASSGFSPLHVSGNKLLDTSNQAVFLHGVNRAGTEYSCINNNGFFDGTGSLASEDAQIGYMAAWHINAEMITLNEDCWLGINGSPAAYSNSSSSPATAGCSATQCPYANAIENIVQTDEANHIHPVISLMFIAPGTTKATSHNTLADNDHAPLFWEEVANFFKNDPNVMFRLEQEPTLTYGSESDWQCWSQGDVSYSTSSVSTPPNALTSTGSPNKCSGLSSYKTVGMQSLVNIIRGAGSNNVIGLPGLGYSNMVSCGPTTAPSTCGMLNSTTPPVVDTITPAQLMASVDVYPEGNTCGQQLNTSCYDATYKPVANVMPFIAGETGENPNNTYTPTTYVDMFMTWLDTNGNGYFPYAWDPWTTLISGYGNNTTPSTTWGTDYYNHINK